MDLNQLTALIFCATEPVTLAELRQCLGELTDASITEQDVAEGLATLQRQYAEGPYPFEIVLLAGGYQFLTKPAYEPTVRLLLQQRSKRRLSTAALETLAIVAYRQPVTKGQVEQVRGVSCDYVLQKLLDKDLIDVQGRAALPGRPLLYGTSRRFMEYFGINDLKELPVPKDFAPLENQIGTDPSDE